MCQATGDKAKTSIHHRYLRETTSYIITRSNREVPVLSQECEEGQEPDNLKTQKGLSDIFLSFGSIPGLPLHPRLLTCRGWPLTPGCARNLNLEGRDPVTSGATSWTPDALQSKSETVRATSCWLAPAKVCERADPTRPFISSSFYRRASCTQLPRQHITDRKREGERERCGFEQTHSCYTSDFCGFVAYPRCLSNTGNSVVF